MLRVGSARETTGRVTDVLDGDTIDVEVDRARVSRWSFGPRSTPGMT